MSGVDQWVGVRAFLESAPNPADIRKAMLEEATLSRAGLGVAEDVDAKTIKLTCNFCDSKLPPTLKMALVPVVVVENPPTATLACLPCIEAAFGKSSATERLRALCKRGKRVRLRRVLKDVLGLLLLLGILALFVLDAFGARGSLAAHGP